MVRADEIPVRLRLNEGPVTVIWDPKCELESVDAEGKRGDTYTFYVAKVSVPGDDRAYELSLTKKALDAVNRLFARNGWKEPRPIRVVKKGDGYDTDYIASPTEETA